MIQPRHFSTKLRLFLTFLPVALFLQGLSVIASDNCRPNPENEEPAEISASARNALRQLCNDAEKGDANALYRLAYLHDIGYDSIPRDTIASTRLYTLAAEKGNIAAMNYLGFRYYRGEGVEKDIQKALNLIEQAALTGDRQAQNNLGYMLVEGEGTIHDTERAAYWLEKAAEAGVAQSQAMLADLLSDGHSLAPDTLRAASLYARAAAGGLHDADYRLHALMKNKWQNLSADSAINLALNLEQQRALRSATKLFELAASKGNARAMTLLGDAYSRAAGVAYDYQKALQLFFDAAMLGDGPAAFYIAETMDIFPDIYDSLLNDSTDPAVRTAQYWYQRAADSGITDAQQAAETLRHPIQ